MTLKERPSASSKECARLLRLAKYAKNSRCKHKHVAACFKGGNVLSIGVNKNTMPNRKWIDGTPCSEHAEVAALRQIKDTRGVTLYVLRVRKDGSSGLSKPCSRCADYIAKSGIKKVIYSVEDSFDSSENQLLAA